ncbi:MAG TPA: pyridoxal-phosphate dependent enzyme [Aliiroseovarius sp.]|nr:pyridoxal-phosphate dependent enzyme [Aliiroseovarius sp.]
MMSDDLDDVTLDRMQARAKALAPWIIHTPSVPLTSLMLSRLLGGAEVIMKLELLQHTGTFKARGALSNALAIPMQDRAKGITAASAGNHAIAAAWAARMIGTSAKVAMQSSANPYRVALARAEGAEVIMKDGGAGVFAEAERLQREEGRSFLHPFDGVNTALGSAGVGLEMMADRPDLDAVVVAVGGGGLIGGVAAAVKAVRPGCAVYGVEPDGADSMSRSLAAGQPVTLDHVDTIADSLAPPFALPFGYGLAKAYVDDIVTVSDDMIAAGMVLYQEEAKLAVEPSAAAVLAAVLGPLRARLQGKKVGLVVCGANIDADTYGQHLERGRLHRDLLTG